MTVDLAAFDLSDDLDVSVLADLLAELGRDAEAALCREGCILVLHDGVIQDAAVAEGKTIACAVREEFARLGCFDDPDEREQPEAYADADLPRGWLRVSDGHASAYARGEHILASLRAKESSGDWFEDVWQSLIGFPSHCTTKWDGVASLVEYSPDGTVVRLHCNGGWRYTTAYGTDDVDAVLEAFEDNSWCETAEEAIDLHYDSLSDEDWDSGGDTQITVATIEELPKDWRRKS